MVKATKQQQKKLTERQKHFAKSFIDIAYENMVIENETPITRQEAHRRYYADAVDLVKDGTYKNVRL